MEVTELNNFLINKTAQNKLQYLQDNEGRCHNRAVWLTAAFFISTNIQLYGTKDLKVISAQCNAYYLKDTFIVGFMRCLDLKRNLKYKI